MLYISILAMFIFFLSTVKACNHLLDSIIVEGLLCRYGGM